MRARRNTNRQTKERWVRQKEWIRSMTATGPHGIEPGDIIAVGLGQVSLSLGRVLFVGNERLWYRDVRWYERPVQLIARVFAGDRRHRATTARGTSDACARPFAGD
jgi:hypothetical protein